MQTKESWLEVMKNTGKRRILDRDGRNWMINFMPECGEVNVF